MEDEIFSMWSFSQSVFYPNLDNKFFCALNAFSVRTECETWDDGPAMAMKGVLKDCICFFYNAVSLQAFEVSLLQCFIQNASWW